MEIGARSSTRAWQPLTPRGVGAFARAPSGRLFLLELVVALLAAGVVGWFAQSAWCPVLTAAIARMPDQGAIRHGVMDWRGAAPQVLAENRFLALSVDLPHAGEAHSPAHLQVELGMHDVQFSSLLGYERVAYWHRWTLPCNRVELTAWWGAWRPPLLALLIAGVVVMLFLSWNLMAWLYSLPALLVGFFANKDLSLVGSWRLCSAALMPGAVLMSAAIPLYRLGWFDLVGLSVALAAHFVLGWVYIVASVLRLERHPALSATESNPFMRAAISQVNSQGSHPREPEADKPPQI